jgi:hypothetical protein
MGLKSRGQVLIMGETLIPLQKNVHVSTEASLCELPSCRNPFVPKRTGKRRQKFCCPAHRKEFFRLARKMGVASLQVQIERPDQRES